MKKRYVYSLLFGVPGFIVSMIVAIFISGAVAGFLWLYVYGDNPWPASVEKFLPFIFVIILFILWFCSIFFGFKKGKSLEKEPGLDSGHVSISVLATVIPVLLIILHQFKVSNPGAKTDTVLCSEFCMSKGYAGSGMPPKNSGHETCSCYGDDGQLAIETSINNIKL